MSNHTSNLRRIGRALLAVALCLYLPFGWLIVIDYPWNEYRLFWISLWPILPGLLPGAWLFHGQDVLEFTTMGFVSLVLIVGLTWLGSRSRVGMASAAALALAVSVPSAFAAYGAFRA